MKWNWNNCVERFLRNPAIGEGGPKPVGDGVSQMKLSVVFEPMN